MQPTVTAQRAGKLGMLDAKTGKFEEVPLGDGSAPHGVIVGRDGAPWLTDSGLNAIVHVDPNTREVRRWPLPEDAANANLNTATFRPTQPHPAVQDRARRLTGGVTVDRASGRRCT